MTEALLSDTEQLMRNDLTLILFFIFRSRAFQERSPATQRLPADRGVRSSTRSVGRHFRKVVPRLSSSRVAVVPNPDHLLRECPWMRPHTCDWIYQAPVIAVLAVNSVFLAMIMWEPPRAKGLNRQSTVVTSTDDEYGPEASRNFLKPQAQNARNILREITQNN
ncbi:unnamed protein product [Timema podura]|uniref:Uncharacterized protein n=1 Tax=Timema podura TaxID=61482 RepID=A0ABN7NN83_TIMPD|nr:unnamed protein product [Timema podura]